MQVYDGDVQHGWVEYVVSGSMPLVLSMRTDEQKTRYLENLFAETYLKDIVARNGIRRSQLEVDFVANLGSRRYYIQSAYQLPDEEKTVQEKASLRGIDDSFAKIVLVRDVTKPTRDEKGILTMSVYDFLLDPDSLKV